MSTTQRGLDILLQGANPCLSSIPDNIYILYNHMTPSRKEMISKIYEKVARKDLIFWCTIYADCYDTYNKFLYNNSEWWITTLWEQYPTIETWSGKGEETYEIVWHDIMIGDILDYLDKHSEIYSQISFNKWKLFDGMITGKDFIVKCGNINADFLKTIYIERTKKRLPLDEQDDDCITFIFWLIK